MLGIKLMKKIPAIEEGKFEREEEVMGKRGHRLYEPETSFLTVNIIETY